VLIQLPSAYPQPCLKLFDQIANETTNPTSLQTIKPANQQTQNGQSKKQKHCKSIKHRSKIDAKSMKMSISQGPLEASWGLLEGYWAHLDDQNGSKIRHGRSLGGGLGAILAPRANKNEKGANMSTKVTPIWGPYGTPNRQKSVHNQFRIDVKKRLIFVSVFHWFLEHLGQNSGGFWASSWGSCWPRYRSYGLLLATWLKYQNL